MDRSANAATAPLRAHLLGPVRLALGDRPLPDDAWPGRLPRQLLLLLLATPGHRLPRDRVLDLLWPNAPPGAALNSFYVALHRLRRVLEPDLGNGRASAYVAAGDDAVGLRPHPDLWVDAEAFVAGLAAAAALPSAARRPPLRDALTLYRGDLLAEEPYADWTAPLREVLWETRRRALLDLAALDAQAGDPLATVDALDSLVATDPTDEAACRALMTAFVGARRPEDGLRRFDRCRRALRDELGVEPSGETRAVAAGLDRAVATPTPSIAPRRPSGLPVAPNPLVGRARDTEAIHELLGDPRVRLVTLTGAGGIGKTRLALETAREAEPEFADGARFVPLAPLRDPALLLPSVARAVGADEEGDGTPEGALVAALRDQELLLILDNVEHLLAEAPSIAELLAACPRLTVLATSREPLRLRAEHEYRLGPLALPPEPRPGWPPPSAATLARGEAVDLFVQRARAVRADFALTDGNASAVAVLCRRLDGLPLAIELAAAQSRHLGPPALLSGLGDRFSLLVGGYRDAPPRHRTMRAAIDWSHELLTGGERSCFRRLAVFVGGFSEETAEEVTVDHGRAPGDVRRVLRSLADKNLIVAEPGQAERRYGMLETVREYALERLAEAGDERTSRDAHADRMLRLAEHADAGSIGSDTAENLDRLDVEHDNLRAALAWTLDRGDVARSLRLGTALARFWSARGHVTEGRRWLARALVAAAADGDRAFVALRAAALTAAAELADDQFDTADAETRFVEALAAWRHLGVPGRVAQCLAGLGEVAERRGDFGRAGQLHQDALLLYRDAHDLPGVATTLTNIGNVAYHAGRWEDADAHWGEALALARSLGDVRLEMRTLNNLGVLAIDRGDRAAAAAHHEAGLALGRRLADPHMTAYALLNLGDIARLSGAPSRAIDLYEQSQALLAEIGDEWTASVVGQNLARAALAQGNRRRAVAALARSVAVSDRLGFRVGLAGAIEGMAEACVAGGDAERAARLFAAGTALREALGVPRRVSVRAWHDRHLAAARAALADDAFAAAWAAGSALSLGDAVAEALAAADTPIAAFGTADQGPE